MAASPAAAAAPSPWGAYHLTDADVALAVEGWQLSKHAAANSSGAAKNKSAFDRSTFYGTLHASNFLGDVLDRDSLEAALTHLRGNQKLFGKVTGSGKFQSINFGISDKSRVEDRRCLCEACECVVHGRHSSHSALHTRKLEAMVAQAKLQLTPKHWELVMQAAADPPALPSSEEEEEEAGGAAAGKRGEQRAWMQRDAAGTDARESSEEEQLPREASTGERGEPPRKRPRAGPRVSEASFQRRREFIVREVSWRRYNITRAYRCYAGTGIADRRYLMIACPDRGSRIPEQPRIAVGVAPQGVPGYLASDPREFLDTRNSLPELTPEHRLVRRSPETNTARVRRLRYGWLQGVYGITSVSAGVDVGRVVTYIHVDVHNKQRDILRLDDKGRTIRVAQ
jgi:hypothetical protein